MVEQRYDAAVRRAQTLRAANPDASPDDLADALVRGMTKELAAVAAVSGGIAAVPGWGTAVALGALTADTAWTMGRLSELVLALGIVHGHDASAIETRKAWVLSVLAMANGAVNGLDGAAARVGARGGATVVARLGAAQQAGVNSKIAARLVARLATEKALTRLGRLVPFGIGAGVGAAGNALITRSVGRAAREFFGSNDSTAPPPRHTSARQRRRAGIIDAVSYSVDEPGEAATAPTMHR